MGFTRNFRSHLAHGLANQAAANEFLNAFDYPKSADGTTFKVAKLVNAATAASAAVTSTSTETAFSTGSYTIPANALAAGSVIKIRYAGIATSTANSDTLQIKTYIGGTGGTALLTSAATDAVNSDIFAGEYNLTIRTAGTSGTFVGQGVYTKVEGASNTATSVNVLTNSTAINTQTTQQLVVTATWSVADVNDSCRLDIFNVEVLN